MSPETPTNWGVFSSFYSIIATHTHKGPCHRLAVQARKNIEQLLMQNFLQAYERFRTVCCIIRELIDETSFTNTPSLFSFDGCLSSVTNIMSQQTNWQRLVHLHGANREELELYGARGGEGLNLLLEEKKQAKR